MRRPVLAIAALLALSVLLPCDAQLAPDARKIAGVAAGEIVEAKASWWGFDPEDSAASLQAAIDSGVPKLVVDKMTGPWVVTPIQLISNQEIVFEEGVEVLAKRGEFRKRNDILFSAGGCENLSLIGYGATWRMWREDYADPELYEHGDWRHSLFLGACKNVKLYGLTLDGSGGDGIYIGSDSAGNPCSDIHIKDVTLERHYRQGISVINAENLLIENTILRDTDGTAPMAGIDFEPNRPAERLVNCVMRNCEFSNNTGRGILLALRNMSADSPDISLSFENCTSTADHGSVWVDLSGSIDEAPDGTIDFTDCVFEDSIGPGILMTKPAARAHTRFVNCSVIDPSADEPGTNPIVVMSRQDATAPAGGIDFIDCVITDATERNPITYVNAGSVGLADITGTLIINRDEQRETVPLTAEALAKWMPVVASRDIPHMTLEGINLQPLVPDAPADSYAFAHCRARWIGHWVLHASEGDEVSLTVQFGQVGKYHGADLPVTITGPSGEEVQRVSVPFMQDTEVAFTAPQTGLYRIDAAPGVNLMAIVASSHPLSVSNEQGPIRLTASPGDYYFWVPAGTREFAVRVSGEGNGEGVRAMLIDPDGDIFDEVDNSAWTHQFEVDLAQGTPGQAWLLRLARPTVMPMDDHHVDLRGVPPLLAPTADALLCPIE